MRWLLLLCIGCTQPQRTSLEGSITCGPMTCSSGQVCQSRESGSQCEVNLDAGVGPYQEYGWTCVELPPGCDGVTRDCFPEDVVSADGRYVTYLCI
ncbi:MAG TPA: hypothetical protein VGC41_04180 [Kofleriaceae bacterium]